MAYYPVMQNSNQPDKLKHYLGQLKVLQDEDLPNALKRVGESATNGDWQENADYEDAVLQKEILEAKIEELKTLIKSLQKPIN